MPHEDWREDLDDRLEAEIHHAATLHELRLLLGTEKSQKKPSNAAPGKKVSACPACGAVLELLPELRACPVCDHILSDEDLAASPPLEDSENLE